MRKRIDEMVLATEIKTKVLARRIVNKLSEKNGNFIEELIKYIIGFVIGALVLAGIYALVKVVILPALQTKTQDMFNYTA